MEREGRKGREGTGIKEGEGEDVEQQGVERGGKEGEGRDGNKGRGGGTGPLRGKRVERGGEEGKRRRNGDVSRLRQSYSLMCAIIKSDEV